MLHLYDYVYEFWESLLKAVNLYNMFMGLLSLLFIIALKSCYSADNLSVIYVYSINTLNCIYENAGQCKPVIVFLVTVHKNECILASPCVK